MANYGVESYLSSGVARLSQIMPGGRVFIQRINLAAQAVGTNTTYTFPKVPDGSYLKVLQVNATNYHPSHTWTTGTNVNSEATLTLTAQDPFGYPTDLLVFATRTTEPTYGVITVNDNGDRLVSTVYPVPEFLGKLTFSTPYYTSLVAPGDFYSLYYTWPYTVYKYRASAVSWGAGRNRLIMWSLPSTTSAVWYTGDSFIPSSVTGSYQVECIITKAAATSATLPEAFVFALDGLGASSDTYGARVYTDTGALTFDSGLNHMNLVGLESSLTFPNVGAAPNSFTASSFSGVTPAFAIPSYYRITNQYTGNWPDVADYEYSEFSGFVRRDGTTLYSATYPIVSNSYSPGSVDAVDYGRTSNLPQLVTNAVTYGGTAF